MAVSAERRIQRNAENGVPVGDWIRRTGRFRRAHDVSALQTAPLWQVLCAAPLGLAFVWLFNQVTDENTSRWQLLSLAAFLLMFTVAAQAGAARGALRLVAGLDATRIPAAVLADRSSSNDALAVGGLIREQTARRYEPNLVSAAKSRCATYQGSISELMDELAATASR